MKTLLAIMTAVVLAGVPAHAIAGTDLLLKLGGASSDSSHNSGAESDHSGSDDSAGGESEHQGGDHDSDGGGESDHDSGESDR